MPSKINPGVLANGKLFSNRALTRRQLENDLNAGLQNVKNYSDSTVGDGTTDARTAIAAADTAGPVVLPPGTYAVASNLTLTKKITFLPGAKLKPASGVTVTLSDGYVANEDQHVFDISDAGVIVLTKKVPVYSEHWGAIADGATNSTTAVQAAINATKNVRFLPGQYICTVTCDPDNGSVLLEGNNTLLTAVNSNEFALTLTGEYANGVCRISNITFYGDNPAHGAVPGRTKHGLLVNIASNLFLDNCWFSFCDLGLVTQLTIITTYSALVFNQCRVGAYYTARTTSTGTLSVTTPRGVVYVLPNPVHGVGHPAEALLVGARFTLCDIGFVVDSPGNEWAPSRDFKIDKPLFQYCKVGMLLLPEAGGWSDHPVIINTPWFEGQDVGTSVDLNGVTYAGCDVHNDGVQAIQYGGWISSIRGRSAGNYRLENASWTTSGDSDFDLLDLQDQSSVTGEIVYAVGRVPFPIRAGVPLRASLGPLFTCAPMISKGYQRRDSAKLLFAKSCEADDLPSTFFGGTSLGVINDGPADVNESLGYLATAGNGVTLQFTGEADSLYVSKFAVKAYCPVRTFTVNAGTDVFTSEGHGFVNNMEVRLFTTTTLPAGSALATSYYVIDATTDTFKLSATVGGASINVTDTGTGTHTVQQITSFDLRTNPVDAGAFIGAVALPTTNTWQTWCINGLTPSSVTDSSFFIGGATATVVRAFLIAQMYVAKVENFGEALELIDSQQFFSKLPYTAPVVEDYVNRANHTGTQNAATISDFKGALLSSLGGTTYSLLLESASSLLNGDANSDGTGDANDLIGAFNGTWSGTAEYSLPPTHTGKSFVLDGAKYITQVAEAGDFSDSTTVAAWVKPNALSGRIVSKRADATAAWELYLESDGSVRFYDGTVYSSATGAITLNNWHHVLLVLNGASSRIYIDGVASGSAFTPSIVTNSQLLNWGRLPAFGGISYLDGELYQCGVWFGKVFNADEILLISDSNLAKPTAFGGFEDLGTLASGTEVFNFNNGSGVAKTVEATGNIALQFVATVPGNYVAIVEMDGTGGHTVTYATTVVGTAPTMNTAANAKTLIPLFYDGTTWFHSGDMNDGYANVLNYSNSTIGDGTTNARAALLAADAVGPVKLPPGTYAIASNITLTNKVTFVPGAKLKPASGVVVTLTEGFVADEDQYVFDITAGGSVSIVTRRAVTPDNFGAVRDGVTDDSAAVTAALESGDSNHINVRFLTGAYVCSSVADMSAGNMRVKVVGNNTALIPATANSFALRFFGLPPIGPMEIRGLAFWGIDRTKDGLEIACVTSAKVENCVFTNCGIGLLINGTIDGTYDNIKIDGCYVGVHMTVRNGTDHPTAIYNVNGRTVTTSASNYSGQSTEQIFTRVDIKHCAIGIVVDQKGSPWARQQDLLMNKVVMHECVVGYVQKGDELLPGNNGNQWVTFQNPWMENIGTAALVHTNQGGPYGSVITYDGDTQEYCGFANLGGYLCIKNGDAGKLYLDNRSFTYLDCSEDNAESYIGPNACLVVHNGRYNRVYRPVYGDYVIPAVTVNNAGGTLAAAYCLPFSGQVSLEHAESGNLLYSKTQFIGDQTINNSGEVFQVADGVLDRKESLGHIVRQTSGPWINGITSAQNQLYVMKFSIRAYSPAYTFTASGDTLAVTGHDLVDGQEVRLTTTGTLPPEFAVGTSYYVVSSASGTLKLSATAGGTAITTSGPGSGTHTIKQKNEFTVFNSNLADGHIFLGSPLITDRWETYFAVGMANSLGTTGDVLMVTAVANLVRKIVLGPVFILKVANESEAMRICRSQAFYATQHPSELIGRKEKVEAVASSATPTLDYSDGDGDTKTHTATSLITPVITMARPGRHDLVITQDATGGREILWPTNMRFRYMAPQPDLTPGKKSLLSWVYDGTHGVADGVQHSDNYIADFDAVGAVGQAVSITFPDAGTIMVKCRLAAATPASKTRLFQTKVSSPDSHYPYTDGDIYCDWLRSTRIDSITPSGSVNRALWHWVIVRTDSTDGWDLIQSISSVLYTIESASHETIGALSFILAPINTQAEIDRVLIFNSRLGDVPIGNVMASTKSTANSDLPSGLLARYELNYDRGGKILQDWSGNGRDITLTAATPSLFVVNSGV
jgi:hypothetical protein